MRFRFARSLALVMTLATPAVAFAQGRPGKGAAMAGKRAEVLEKIRAVRAARIVEVLNLDEATATRLFAILNRYDDQILPLKQEIGQSRRELRALMASGKLDDATGNRLVDKIFADRAQIARLEDQRNAEVRKMLPVRQFATLVVALPEIEREIEHQIRKAVERRRGGGGGGGAGESDDFE
jgi:Spy/CpxP family protein refolding chaperone